MVTIVQVVPYEAAWFVYACSDLWLCLSHAASETWDMEYGPCLEPALAQTNIGFSKLSSHKIFTVRLYCTGKHIICKYDV